jgi:hypothetical protein
MRMQMEKKEEETNRLWWSDPEIQQAAARLLII